MFSMLNKMARELSAQSNDYCPNSQVTSENGYKLFQCGGPPCGQVVS